MIPCGPCCPNPDDKPAMRQYCRICAYVAVAVLIVVGLIVLVKAF